MAQENDMDEKITLQKEKFETRVQSAIIKMKRLGYTPRLFIQMINESDSVTAIKTLLHKRSITDGFTRLWEMKRLDLSMENIVYSEDWGELFTPEEKAIARRRLEEYEFFPKEPLSKEDSNEG